MRASKEEPKVATSAGCPRRQTSKFKKSKAGEIHISGAEGLYEFSDLEKITKGYLYRAMGHPRGRPDKVVITLEVVAERPLGAPVLPFSTVNCGSPEATVDVIEQLLSKAGISRKAIRSGIRLVTARAAMSGAALILSESGRRADPDKERGIRVSRLGITGGAERGLARKLARKGINTAIVKEAIILASKVASCRGVIAELCVSDDPDYTTGYVASRIYGYVRIPHIKPKGSLSGGRVFFVDEMADAKSIIEYLEKRPVFVGT